MATFYYPDRSSPTTTLTISPLESYPSNRKKTKLQSRDRTPGGTKIVYDLGPQIEYLELGIRLLSKTDKDNLKNFIETIVNWASNTWDFTDDQGFQFDSCIFDFDDVDYKQRSLELFNFDLFVEVG